MRKYDPYKMIKKFDGRTVQDDRWIEFSED